MARIQRLSNVCNGSFIHNLYDLTEKELRRCVEASEAKVFLITDTYQLNTNALLRRLKKKRGATLRVKCLGYWNPHAYMWYAWNPKKNRISR